MEEVTTTSLSRNFNTFQVSKEVFEGLGRASAAQTFINLFCDIAILQPSHVQ
jgi:hypothetical protein